MTFLYSVLMTVLLGVISVDNLYARETQNRIYCGQSDKTTDKCQVPLLIYIVTLGV